MKTADETKSPVVLTSIYFTVAMVLVVCEVMQEEFLIYIFKPMLIPSLFLLYFFTSSKRSLVYVMALGFALLSNIFFISTDRDFLLLGVISFLFYRIMTIILVFRAAEKIYWLPFVVGTIPFLFVFCYLFDLTRDALQNSFYPAVANGLLMSVLAGISLSSYVFNDNKKNSWLLISSLLFVVLVFIFVIQKYYLFNTVFQPLSAIIFAAAHYTFYKFVLLDEDSNKLIL